MSVVSVRWQTHLSRTGDSSDATATAEEYFIVICSADTDSTQVWGAVDPTSGLIAPTYGSLHPTQGTLYCNGTQYTPAEQNTRRIFQVRANYTDDFDQDPLTEPAAIEWDFAEDGDQPYFLDFTSPATPSNYLSSTAQPPTSSSGPKMVTNSAGEQFSDFLTRNGGSITATYSVNVEPSSAASIAQTLVAYTYPVPSINSGGFTFDGLSIGTGQALIKGGTIGAVQRTKIEGEWVYYRNVKYSLAYKQNWDDSIDDRGYNEQWGSDPSGNTTLKEIVKGLPPVKPDRPWPLDGSGAAKPNITDPPSKLTFKPYPQQSFGVFDFE
jgi:hypothetical protein